MRSASVVTLDEFHHEPSDAIALLQAVDGAMLRMIQRGEDFGFALESRQPLWVCRKASGRTLIATCRFKVGISRAIHLTHAADADLGGDFIRAEAGASSESHGKWLRL